MTDTVLAQIAAAQAAPADDYMVWAEIGTGSATDQVILHTVRLPQSIPVPGVSEQIKSHASKSLSDVGYSSEQIDKATLQIAPLPSAAEVEAELQTQRDAGSEMVLADLTFWEACRL